MTEVVALRSSCPRMAVGAVMTVQGRIISTGYNGSPRGTAHCEDAGCIVTDGHCIRAVHAEHNALLFANLQGVSMHETILYCSHLPCWECLKIIIQLHVGAVCYHRSYRDNRCEKFGYTSQIDAFRAACIDVFQEYPVMI